MKVASITALSPTVTPWKKGQTLSASSWSSVDDISDLDGSMVRTISHYSTEMVEFVWMEWTEEWSMNPLSVGRSSQSDRAGIRKLGAAVNSPLLLCKGFWVNIYNARAIDYRDSHLDGGAERTRAHNEMVGAHN